YWGIDREYYNLSHTDKKWKLLNRAYLRVPIAEYSPNHIDQFRLWLDGYENITTTVNDAVNPYYFKNPELFGDGKTYLSTAIYPGHPNLSRSTLLTTSDLLGRPGVVFSHRTAATTASLHTSSASALSAGSALGNYFKAGSGEALGTILDFFSPPASGIGGVTKDAHNVRSAPESSFPLKDPCDKNWVILFTAGDDSGDVGFTSANAVSSLYNFTKENNLTKFKEYSVNQNVLESIKLQDGVRTLVVGFVDPDSTAPNVAALRTKLNAMAVAGDPGNSQARAYFANDVEGLIHALRSVLARINSEIQPAKGPMLEGDSFGDESFSGLLDDEEVLNLYAGSYRINIYDQWEGNVIRYETKKNSETGELTTTKNWDLNSKLKTARSADAGSRYLFFWAGSSPANYVKLAYTPDNASGAKNIHPIMGNPYNVNLVPPIASMDESILQSGVDFDDRFHPSRAIVDWLYGKEVSYIAGTKGYVMYDRRNMVADQGQSGIVKVGPPPDINSLPDFHNFAQAVQGLYPIYETFPTQIFFQSNEGILHAVDAKTGYERMALVPPPMLMPYRLFDLKTTKAPDSGKYRWINVDGALTTTSDDIPITSIPSFTLDGPLQARYFDMSDTEGAPYYGWRTLLIGTLGRGGGGIYAFDVTEPAPVKPDFMWYRETYEPVSGDGDLLLFRQTGSDGIDPAKTVISRGSAYWADVYAHPGNHAFEQLGFNSPRPHFGAVRRVGEPDLFHNVIALGGGAQNFLDLERNGAMGAALYLVDPDVSYHGSNTASDGLRVFNSGSVAGAPAKWKNTASAPGVNIPNPYMGMIVTEPVFLASDESNYIADGVFTGDNRGNVFLVSFANHADGSPLARGDWKIRTVASLRKPSDPDKAAYSFPTGVVVGSRIDRVDEMWVAGGTSDIGTRGASDENDTRIRNAEQMIFCFKLPNLKDDSALDSGMSYRSGGNNRPGWTLLDSEDADSGIDAGGGYDGWYIPLKKAGTDIGGKFEAEYVTTQPIMFGGYLFVGTFRQKVLDTNNSGLCESGKVLGESRLFALGMDTGMAGMWDSGDKYLKFDGMKMTGFTVSEKGDTKTLIITYEVLDQAAAEASITAATGSEDTVSRVGGDLPALAVRLTSSGGTRPLIKSNDGVLNYWLLKNN
ncbi:MAG: hypothetical protein LBR87_01520, partial [Synergistaceae bacterium]|nr:hypothetical protein [Synergistaceae bacterium]